MQKVNLLITQRDSRMVQSCSLKFLLCYYPKQPLIRVNKKKRGFPISPIPLSISCHLYHLQPVKALVPCAEETKRGGHLFSSETNPERHMASLLSDFKRKSRRKGTASRQTHSTAVCRALTDTWVDLTSS